MASLEEPTPLWLVLTIESTRYRFTTPRDRATPNSGPPSLKKKCQSQTAGEMASVLHAFVKSEVKYPGRARATSNTVAYLKRTTRLKFRQIDIERVCEFLMPLPRRERAAREAAEAWLEQHPESVLLNFQSGMLAVACSRPPFIPSGRPSTLRKHSGTPRPRRRQRNRDGSRHQGRSR